MLFQQQEPRMTRVINPSHFTTAYSDRFKQSFYKKQTFFKINYIFLLRLITLTTTIKTFPINPLHSIHLLKATYSFVGGFVWQCSLCIWYQSSQVSTVLLQIHTTFVKITIQKVCDSSIYLSIFSLHSHFCRNYSTFILKLKQYETNAAGVEQPSFPTKS